ncbi:MAG: hypothetical protein K0S47_2139 [Herbinix sp.]|jgi:hypothetical protein|nr:hypothetical protein [Herbinix sp.]
MKKLLYVIPVILIAIVVYFNYSSKFYIKNNAYEIQENLQKFLQRSEPSEQINVKQVIDLDNMKFVLAELKDSFGFAKLTRGLNRKYKIDFIEYGGNGNFKGYIYKTNQGKYLIVYGRNSDKKIKYIKAAIENNEYRIVIPEGNLYIAFCKVPDETKTVFPDRNDYKFFDQNDKNIYE